MRSTNSLDYQEVPRPVAAMAREYEAGAASGRHSHPRAQLLYAISGVMTVLTDKGAWIVPPRRAVWLPGGTGHEVRFRGKVSLRTLYIRPDARARLPDRCMVIEVSQLLCELILTAISLPIEYELSGREERIMALILDEIVLADIAPFHLPMPTSTRLFRACERILRDPASDIGLDQMSKDAHMARRTFTRRFRAETSMSFEFWRKHVRLLEAVVRLSTGQSVTTVALDVGYESPSAFSAVFRKTFNASPSQFLPR